MSRSAFRQFSNFTKVRVITPQRTFLNWLFPSFASKVIYPAQEVGVHQTTRIYPHPIRFGEPELSTYLISTSEVPIILNFTLRGDESCNKVSRPLYDLLNFQIAKKINSIDIEMDQFDNRDLLLTYGVRKTPTLVCLEKQLIKDFYTVNNLEQVERIDEDDLKSWIEKMALEVD